MYIQPHAIFSFSNTAILTGVFVALSGFPFLNIPVGTIIRLISTAPTRMILRIASKVVVPAILRAKLPSFLVSASAFVCYMKSFPTTKTRFESLFLLQLGSFTPLVSLTVFACDINPFITSRQLLGVNTFTFLRTRFTLMVAFAKLIYISANDAIQCIGVSFTSVLIDTIDRTKATLIFPSWLSMLKIFPAVLAFCSDKYSAHDIKYSLLSEIRCCLGIRSESKRNDYYNGLSYA